MRYISETNFTKLLYALNKDYQVYLPVEKNRQYFYERYSGFNANIAVSGVRSVEPAKAFFFPAREIVSRDFKDSIPHANDKPFAVVGLKACDLKSFKVQDHVFKNHDYQDPFYLKAREQNLLITADCSYALEVCFCLALGLRPYPQRDFDINLSQVEGGFVVEVGSGKGQKIIDQHSSLFEEASPQAVSQREEQRSKVIGEVDRNIRENDIPPQEMYAGVIEKKFESDIWQDEAKTCVECGACNTVCPTCHCFLLYDQKDEERMARLRIWDSCMIKDYAQVAGGANPREKLWMRLRNRFEKKFDFFPKVADVYACTGCGRCILACPAKIDIRKVLKRLVSDAQG